MKSCEPALCDLYALVLSSEEIRRRIVAARELIGMSQEDLGALLEQEGYGKHDVGRLERRDPKMPLTPGRRTALAKHLRVPEAWFTAERDELFPAISDQVDAGPQLKKFLDEIRELVDDYSFLASTATPRQTEELKRRTIERMDRENGESEAVVARHREDVSQIVREAERDAEQQQPTRSSRRETEPDRAEARRRRRA